MVGQQRTSPRTAGLNREDQVRSGSLVRRRAWFLPASCRLTSRRACFLPASRK